MPHYTTPGEWFIRAVTSDKNMSDLFWIASHFVVLMICFQHSLPGFLGRDALHPSDPSDKKGRGVIETALSCPLSPNSPLIAVLVRLCDHIIKSSKRSVELIIPHCLRQEQEMN